MRQQRKRFNPKRAIDEAPEEVDLDRLAERVQYGGNPEHKRNPGDFGLTPPAIPRPDKSLCDEVQITRRTVALHILRRGIQRGLVSVQRVGDLPQNIWSMTDDEVPVEAQLENRTTATYHGYPMPEADPFSESVRARWHGQGRQDR